MIATSTCACAVVVHVYFRGQGKVPYILRKIFLEFLARILCMVTPSITIVQQQEPTEQQQLQQQQQQQQFPTLAASTTPMKQMKHSSLSNNLANDEQQKHHHIYQQQLSNKINNNNNNNKSFTSLDLEVDKNNQIITKLARTGGEPYQLKQLVSYDSSTISNSYKNTLIQSRLEMQRHASLSYCHNNNNVNNGKRFIKPNRLKSEANLRMHEKSEQFNRELSISFNVIENDIKEIRDYLRHTRKKTEVADIKIKNTNEWKQLALILDRTLFFLYIIAIVVSVTLMFPK
jgi:hypothetical protein